MGNGFSRVVAAARGLALTVFLIGCDPAAPGRTEAPADPEAGEVPIRLVGPQNAALLVPVHLNGAGPYDFVFDTGATWTCLESGVASELGLRPEAGPDGVGVGVGGATRVQMVRLDSVRVGAASAIDMPACVLDLEHLGVVGTQIHGLVGLNFMRAFHVSLDFQREVVVLTDP